MPSERRIVYGLGSGGCGTRSLAHLLTAQPDTRITHEGLPHLPWLANPVLLDRHLATILERRDGTVGNVAFYLLPYVPMIWKRQPKARFICLRRERTSCLGSLIAKMHRGQFNVYQHHSGRRWRAHGVTEKQFPKYDHAPSMEHAIARYYDDYYHQAEWFAQESPERFRIFALEDLNTEEGVASILDFAGFPRSEQNVTVGIRENQAPEPSPDPDLRA